MILPLTVLRRLDCVLAPTKQKVLEVEARYKGQLGNLDGLLRGASGFAFYNTSRYDFGKLLADAPDLAKNLRAWIAGFSPNMREVLEKFDFDNTISKLDEAGLLFQVLQRFGDPKVNLHPDEIDNFTMGTIFEELIRKFNEALNENPGEHFTPRDVVHLMVDLMLAGDEEELQTVGVARSVYDPCCGSGGMLTIAKEHTTLGEIREAEVLGEPVNPDAHIHLFGQDVNPETFAVCKSDLFMKSKDGGDANNILFGSTLSNDRHAGTGSAPRRRRLDRQEPHRPPGRRGRTRRLRDQLQPLLLRVSPAPPSGGDRGRYPAGGEGDRGDVEGDDGLTPGMAPSCDAEHGGLHASVRRERCFMRTVKPSCSKWRSLVRTSAMDSASITFIETQSWRL